MNELYELVNSLTNPNQDENSIDEENKNQQENDIKKIF